MLRTYQLSISATEEHLDCLKTLPWHVPLEEWRSHGVRHLQFRSGLSRHIVIFIERNHRRYAIKQTSPEIARREIENFRRLRKLDLPTSQPVGYAITDNGKTLVSTAVGMQMEDTAIGFCITQLAERTRRRRRGYGQSRGGLLGTASRAQLGRRSTAAVGDHCGIHPRSSVAYSLSQTQVAFAETSTTF